MTNIFAQDEIDAARFQHEKTEAGRAQKWDEEVVKALMSTAPGRMWVEKLLEECNMYSDAYREDGDVYAAMKRDGRASIGRYIVDQIDKYAPNNYNQMMRERRTRLARASERKIDSEPASTGPWRTKIEVLEEEMAANAKRGVL